MSGENPILLLKSAITHSIAPSHTQTLTEGEKTNELLLSPVGNPSGCCCLHRECPQVQRWCRAVGPWVTTLPCPLLVPTGAQAQAVCCSPEQAPVRCLLLLGVLSGSSTARVAFLGAFLFYKRLFRLNLYLGPSLGK